MVCGRQKPKKKKGKSDIIKMAAQDVPDLSPPHKKTNYQLFINKAPLRNSQNLGARLKHPLGPQRPKSTALDG